MKINYVYPLKNYEYINRELSWLSFNERVLQEAEDKSVPLIERIKFLGIYSNNRDEFFRVRVATVRRMINAGKKAEVILGEDPNILLGKIQKTVITHSNKFEGIYQELLHDLGKQNIYIINEKMLTEKQGAFVRQYFQDEVMSALVPIMVDTAPQFPYLNDKSIYFLVKLNRKNKKPKYSLIEIPSQVVPRFLILPQIDNKKYIILLDDVIRFCLDDVFSILEYETAEAYTIKLTRDAELEIDSDISQSLVEKMTKSLKKRKRGLPVRLTYDYEMTNDMLAFLMRKIDVLKQDNLIPGGRYHNFKDFINFPNMGNKQLVYQNPHELDHPELAGAKSLLKVISKKDVLVSYPYQGFHHIIDVLREASIDPKVESIKITLYRAAKQSRILNALLNAIKNGKKVVAVVELQARFDEEANINFATKLQEEGAKVIYGVPNLKVHSKLFLITRRERGKPVKYVHIGTGNFNENTAKIYSDSSLLTANKLITSEVSKLFSFYENNHHRPTFKQLLVAPFNMRKGFVELINKEISNAKKGKQAYIIMKLNNLVDPNMIKKLYDAGQAGVKVKIIARGICSIIPGESYSKNIECISIVDKYLEHSRVFIFCNGGNEKYFISSGDWMPRNLDLRSEVAVPIFDKEIQNEIREIIEIQLNDNVKARILNKKQDNQYKKTDSKKKIRAQEEIFYFLKHKTIQPTLTVKK